MKCIDLYLIAAFVPNPLEKKNIFGLHLLELGCCFRAHNFFLHLIQNKQLDTECIIERKRGRQVNKYNTCAVPGWHAAALSVLRDTIYMQLFPISLPDAH